MILNENDLWTEKNWVQCICSNTLFRAVMWHILVDKEGHVPRAQWNIDWYIGLNLVGWYQIMLIISFVFCQLIKWKHKWSTCEHCWIDNSYLLGRKHIQNNILFQERMNSISILGTYNCLTVLLMTPIMCSDLTCTATENDDDKT